MDKNGQTERDRVRPEKRLAGAESEPALLGAVSQEGLGEKGNEAREEQGDRSKEQKGKPLPERHGHETIYDKRPRDVLLERRKLHTFEDLRHALESFARDVPELASLFIFGANQKNREVFTQAAHSANLLLVCRQAVVEMAQRVAAEGIQGTREFQTEDCK